ncbi:type VII toxin-antitoxin system HepT family RNase toxin [Jeotgalibacillus malaysiensis]|uniref:type VII toxin-antitoxin system HepT family RNase toxin n=1 Tax=Jeotgalibacillus malaysiensis TaxID=1508404 RepID=UPI003850E317
MKSDVIVNKVTSIERCLRRVREVYDNSPENLTEFTKQDSIVLNIQRACQVSIDLAMHIVQEKKLGIPKTSREAFELLEQAKLIDTTTSKNLKAMVGFRNIAVHEYQDLELEILQAIIEEHLNDFNTFTEQILKMK